MFNSRHQQNFSKNMTTCFFLGENRTRLKYFKVDYSPQHKSSNNNQGDVERSQSHYNLAPTFYTFWLYHPPTGYLHSKHPTLPLSAQINQIKVSVRILSSIDECNRNLAIRINNCLPNILIKGHLHSFVNCQQFCSDRATNIKALVKPKHPSSTCTSHHTTQTRSNHHASIRNIHMNSCDMRGLAQ